MILRLLLISSLLVGCSLDRVKRDEPPQIITEWITFDCGVPPARDKVSFSIPTFRIIDGLYTLTPDNYARLGEAMTDITASIMQMIEVIKFYENCIEAAQ